MSNLDLIRQSLNNCREFFESRDYMNASVHLSEVRWSPITKEVVEALEALDRIEAEWGKDGADAQKPA